jgi:rhodanese-related sulfurtransferase
MIRHIKPILALLLVAVGPACAEAPAAPTISPADLATRISDASAPVIFDVRSAKEFASGHVPGAVNLPHDEVTERLAELNLDPDDEIVVYCESGRRAATAETALRQAGFTGVRHLEGDMRGWRESDLPCDGC